METVRKNKYEFGLEKDETNEIIIFNLIHWKGKQSQWCILGTGAFGGFVLYK
jgi:hypothetical protein